jgi:spore coat polysaccharide biosynthesis protein SpsF
MIVGIVQARMGSTRLPGKVLAPIMGRPMLYYQLERLRRCRRLERLIVATTVEQADDAIVTFCGANGADVMRGSEADVLARFAQVARASDADIVVRLTADCPLIDAQMVDQAVDAFVTDPQCDYLSNMIEPTWPLGMAVEVMKASALLEAEAEATDPAEREHVTPFLYWRPTRFRLRSLTRRPNLSHLRLTVDTAADLDLVTRLLVALYPIKADFTIDDVLETLSRHPDWEDINRTVTQKAVSPITEEGR